MYILSPTTTIVKQKKLEQLLFHDNDKTHDITNENNKCERNNQNILLTYFFLYISIVICALSVRYCNLCTYVLTDFHIYGRIQGGLAP